MLIFKKNYKNDKTCINTRNTCKAFIHICGCMCVCEHICMFLGFSWEHQMNFLVLKQVIKDKVKHNKYHN